VSEALVVVGAKAAVPRLFAADAPPVLLLGFDTGADFGELPNKSRPSDAAEDVE
jgi:hypothetical protein